MVAICWKHIGVIMSMLTVAAVQMACDREMGRNIDRAERLIREAASLGAKVVVPQELFATPYFCQDQDPGYFALAHSAADHPLLARMGALAASLGIVLPISFFERANNAYFNSLAVFDADGTNLGVYRKSHIPDGPGYQEKFYFNPGDTGFRVFHTRFGRLGCAVCWDQWFPECARVMALKGAELLIYPTAIGSEPQDATIDSRDHWTRVMQGHAGANLTPLIAANRIGCEIGHASELTFYGSSFIAGATGEILALAARDEEAVIVADLDLDAIARQRAAWGVFRDRRPDLYGGLLSLDGDRRPDSR